MLGQGAFPFDGFTDPNDDPYGSDGHPGRNLLTGISFGNALMNGQGVQGNSLSVQQPLWETTQPLNPQVVNPQVVQPQQMPLNPQQVRFVGSTLFRGV